MKWKILTENSNYEISENGDVRNIKRGNILKPGLKKGYHSVGIAVGDERKSLQIHRLVGKYFLPPASQEIINECLQFGYEPRIDHINGIKTDNHYKNLRWCTPKQNSNYHFASNGQPTGINSKLSKLNQEQLSEMTEAIDNGTFNTKYFSNKFGIGESSLGKHLRAVGIHRYKKK